MSTLLKTLNHKCCSDLISTYEDVQRCVSIRVYHYCT